MNRPPRSLIKTGVVGSALSIVVLVWIFVFGQVDYERREAVNAAVRANIQRVTAFEQYVVRTLEGADIATTYVAEQYASTLQGSAQSPPPIVWIDDSTLRAPAVREISVINRNGDLVATNTTPLPEPFNVRKTVVFRQHRSRPSTSLQVNAPSRSRLSGNRLLLLSRRVNLPDGSFGGVIAVRIHPNEMTNFLQHAALDDTDLVSVMGLDGITRARREGNKLSFGEDLRGSLVMRMQEHSPNGTYLGPSSIDGIYRYFSHRRLPKYGIFVTSGVSQAKVLAPVQARANGYFIGGALITLVTILAAGLVLVLIKRRNAHEAEILTANARLQAAQQLAKLGDWSFDLAKKEFHWSEGMCEMYQRPSTEKFLSLPDYAKVVGQHAMQIFQAALKQSETYGGRQEFELAVRLPSGSVSHRHIVSIADFDAFGQLTGIHGTDQDITPRKLLEALQLQVSHLSKLDALHAIAATVAHELNQPLTAALNYLSGSIRLLTVRADRRDDLIVDALGAVREQINHAGQIIRRVRNLISNGQPQMDAISLSGVITSAITLVEVANPGLKVTFEQGPDVEHVEVMADPVQIQQVLVNLIRNAHESCITAPQIIIRTKLGKGQLVDVLVIDNGPGIANDGRDLFSSFTSSKDDGLGLGLAISRTLVEAMGGEIWVEETGAHGTVICFNVPLAQAAVADSSPVHRDQQSYRSG